MSAESLLAALQARGLHVERPASGARAIVVRGPGAPGLDPAIVAEVRAHSRALLARLIAEEREAAAIVAEVERAGWRLYERDGSVFIWSARPFDTTTFSAFAPRARACKNALLASLRADAAREAFEERAAILEYEAGLTRAEAERRVANETINPNQLEDNA